MSSPRTHLPRGELDGENSVLGKAPCSGAAQPFHTDGRSRAGSPGAML